MNIAETITRGTVWAALLCYAAAAAWLALRKHSRTGRLALILWTVGCLFFLAHVAAAFHFYHHWSHAAAADDTRRQTAGRLGLDFRGGLWFNYAFALVWLVDCVAWWIIGADFRDRNQGWHIALQVWFLFMIFNATVIFGHGIARPAGAVLCLVAGAALARIWRIRRGR